MKKYSIPFIFWTVLFVILPLLLVVVYAFNGVKSMDMQSFTFSLENFTRFFESLYIRILIRSVWLALASTAVCLIMGYPIAYIISQMEAKKGSMYILLFIIPMWMNFLLRTYAWITLLGRNGVLNRILGLIGLGPFDMMYNQGSILMGMIYNFLPFMVLPIYTILTKMDHSLIDAAKDLGATPRMVFQKVILPLSVPGITSGILMCFIPALSTFVISSLLGGNKYYLVGNLIEQQYRFTGNWPFGSAVSVVLIVIMFVLLGAFRLFTGPKKMEGRK
ncbi:ABC transporter permease [Peptoniphilus sp. KCTC 25270]|uniref:ABC transporter permease n=1 Tax=Peptoniphilus sp. KCTC 25270 TaxID=2897414 RepID=UPI001E43BE19|nr:ABC transporter permease [Peptoniphilus sp. KCTC 25270]MCD1148024.1 ABC transporter permease [Peptoniphilus sp. KCTC 25270]